MKKITLLSALFILLLSGLASGQSEYCNGSTPFCLDQPVTFEAETTGTAEPGAYYSCLATQIAPSWFHMRILDPGNITIYLYSTPLVDIDFICWGPFTDPYEPCVTGLTSNKVIDCSYSPSPTEFCEIPNGQTGQYYILMVTNFSQQPADITFSKSGGNGSLDCSLFYGPDLLVKYPEIYPETLLAGDTLTVSSSVFNHGNQDAAVSKLFYYLSTDTIYNHNDLELGYDYTGTLDAGDSIFLNYTDIIPQGTPPGPWYILFFADADEQIEESEEDNNVNYIGFTVDTATGIDDQGANANARNIIVYPNPASDRLYIDYAGLSDGPVEIDIFNIQGKLMIPESQKMLNQSLLSISTRDWPPGFYFLRIKVDGEVIYRKVEVV